MDHKDYLILTLQRENLSLRLQVAHEVGVKRRGKERMGEVLVSRRDHISRLRGILAMLREEQRGDMVMINDLTKELRDWNGKEEGILGETLELIYNISAAAIERIDERSS